MASVMTTCVAAAGAATKIADSVDSSIIAARLTDFAF
jgi:hypothetical protein